MRSGSLQGSPIRRFCRPGKIAPRGRFSSVPVTPPGGAVSLKSRQNQKCFRRPFNQLSEFQMPNATIVCYSRIVEGFQGRPSGQPYFLQESLLMRTEKHIAASSLNGRKSSGASTSEGKSRIVANLTSGVSIGSKPSITATTAPLLRRLASSSTTSLAAYWSGLVPREGPLWCAASWR